MTREGVVEPLEPLPLLVHCQKAVSYCQPGVRDVKGVSWRLAVIFALESQAAQDDDRMEEP